MLSNRRPTSFRPLTRLRHFAARSRQERLLLVEALWRLAALRLFLLIYGSRRQPRLYGRASKPAIGAEANAKIVLSAAELQTAQRVGWAIKRAEKLLPFDVVCLPQALVGRRMLRNRGLSSVMYFGVEKNKPIAEVGTHAWLVSGPARVTGFPQAARYKVFASYVPLQAPTRVARRAGK